MALAHLTAAGFVEFAVTAGVVAYLQRANLPLLRINHRDGAVDPGDARPRARVRWRWALIGLGVMVGLTPLGLLAPGGAFGEAAPGKLALGRYGLKAVPVGLARWNGFWRHAVLGGYGLGSGNHPVAGYLISAVVGIAVICLAVLAIIGIIRLVDRGKPRGKPRGKVEDAPDEVGTLTA
jgi:cobalt/nickel transport system permease protein